jgi:antitoxin (DNA-binding transcriptional repressor) of toxin-antitoxin stability system
MTITAVEFENHCSKYIDLSATQDIYITRDGVTVAKVVNPNTSAVESLRGILKNIPENTDGKSIREERLLKYEDNV